MAYEDLTAGGNSSPPSLQKAIDLCNAREFARARRLLRDIVAASPDHSEARRLLAQVEMELGDIDAAVSACEEAVRLDPGNEWALILLGNLHARYRKDRKEGERYYRLAVERNPGSALARINLAAMLGEAGDAAGAEALFREALEREPGNLNAVAGLSSLLLPRGGWDEAFALLSSALPAWRDRPEDSTPLRAHAAALMVEAAQRICEGPDASRVANEMKREAEEKGGIPIRFEKDDSLSVPSKLELARQHKRDFHVVRYNPSVPHWHPVAHQLQYLLLWNDGDKASRNQVILSDERRFEAFRTELADAFGKVRKDLPEDEFARFVRSLHSGVISQLMNGPVDLVIEARLYRERPGLRPAQLLSLLSMQKSGVESVRLGSRSDLFPRKIVSANRVLNLAAALQIRELFGIEPDAAYAPLAKETASAEEILSLAHATDAENRPGGVFDLVRASARVLGCERWFAMGPESEYVIAPTPEEKAEEAERAEKQAAFDEKHKGGGGPAVTAMMSMYMAGALEDLGKRPIEEVRRIAAEIALLGTNGISPSRKSGYSVPSLPGCDFGGYQMLAWYYVSFALSMPELLPRLNLPFAGAYELAKQMHNGGKDGQS